MPLGGLTSNTFRFVIKRIEAFQYMLDRVARLPGAPCLLARGTRLSGIAFYHVNGSFRAIPASRGEINRQNMAARGKFFYAESGECKTTVLYTEKRPLAE